MKNQGVIGLDVYNDSVIYRSAPGGCAGADASKARRSDPARLQRPSRRQGASAGRMGW